MLVPQYFLEQKVGIDYPPAITHPEYFYGFLGVAIAWQVAFLIIGQDPLRFRPMMLPSALRSSASRRQRSHYTPRADCRASYWRPDSCDLVFAVLFLDRMVASAVETGRLHRSPTTPRRIVDVPSIRHDAISFFFRRQARRRQFRRALSTFTTPHGTVETPAFMPVGTQGTVKGVDPGRLRETGAQIILANTYHLTLRPGEQTVAALGGLHAFMGWDGPILTDSGGFQVFSLAERMTIDEQGVRFRSHIDGALVELTPERAVAIQEQLGSDVAMVLGPRRRRCPTTATWWPTRCGAACAGPSAARPRPRDPTKRCSPSCKAGSMPSCVPSRPRGSWRWISSATRSAD